MYLEIISGRCEFMVFYLSRFVNAGIYTDQALNPEQEHHIQVLIGTSESYQQMTAWRSIVLQ